MFREAMKQCDDLCQSKLPQSLLSVIYPSDDDGIEGTAATDGDLLQTATFTMPALFAVEYALLQVFLQEGCVPRAVVGHSIGEYVAAVAAGCLDLPTALELVVQRGLSMDAAMPAPSPGAMWALRATAATAEAAIQFAGLAEGSVRLAAVNGPKSVVISGPHDDLEAVFTALPEGTRRTRVRASHPDHVRRRRRIPTSPEPPSQLQ